jgi:serine/threonine protein kinase
MESIIQCDIRSMLGPAEEEWAGVSAEAKDLVLGLLEPHPKRRLTAAQALEHAWFTAGPPLCTSRFRFEP